MPGAQMIEELGGLIVIRRQAEVERIVSSIVVGLLPYQKLDVVSSGSRMSISTFLKVRMIRASSAPIPSDMTLKIVERTGSPASQAPAG
jgi:hypothetical protein